MNEISRLQFDPISPREVRYIKLGPNNAWFDACIQNDRIEFGHSDVSHEAALERDWSRVRTCWGDKISKGKASDFLREVKDFYTLGSDCLWITFAGGRLYWAFAEQDVILDNRSTEGLGSRYRKVIGSWQCVDRFGKTLRLDNISSKLTKTAAYRQTICSVHARDYALRLINGEQHPEVRAAQVARSAFMETLVPLIQSLHETDFEILTDLLFSRLGWVRISGVGGTQKDTDMILEQPATKMRALVQVKSSANQSVLDKYERQFSSMPGDIGFFVCHSPTDKLQARGDINIWQGCELADRVVEAGLVDWIFARAT